MNRYIFIFIIAVVLTSCKTNQLYINVTQPAAVTMPPDIKKVGVINRSVPTDETKIIDVIDKVLSLEGADLDRDGAWASINGLAAELKRNDRFDEVRLLNDIDLRASGVGVLPAPLSGSIVDSICRVTGIDALFALERFDTDTRVNYSTRMVKANSPLGNIPLPEHQVEMETIIKTGWRIYDPARKTVLDEYRLIESLVYFGKGINPVAAVEGLIKRKESVREVSNISGQKYAQRLLPYRLRITRDYFVKGTNNFKIAKRKAQTGKWDEAGQLWYSETGNNKSKIAGRACYNMAIISEINGNLDDALGWAQKSWEDYRIKPGLRYSGILEGRKYNEGILQIQESY